MGCARQNAMLKSLRRPRARSVAAARSPAPAAALAALRRIIGAELNVYLPILVLGGIAAAFAVGSVAIASLAGPTRYNKSKQAAYECGIEPTETSVSGPNATAGQRFPVKYYLTAMLFIVFDIEIVFLYPWAVTFNKLGAFGLVEMVTFVVTVLIAYTYVWRRGGLDWD